MSCGCRNFFLIEICDVRIGDDDVRPKGFARAEANSRRRPVFDEKFVTGELRRSFPPRSSKSLTMALTKAPVPPIAK